MYRMFYDAAALKSVNVSSFDTSQVTSLREMFEGCKSLSELDIANFDTSKVGNMSEFLLNAPLYKLTVGEKFIMPTGSNGNISLWDPKGENYTGKWIRMDWEYGPYTGKEFRHEYKGDAGMAGTYIPEPYFHATFDANGGSGTMKPTRVVMGEEYILPASTFTAPEGKVFAGWLVSMEDFKSKIADITIVMAQREFSRAMLDGKAYKPGDSIGNITGDVTVQAQWKDAEYTIGFAANGGSGDMTAATVVHGDNYTLPENGFTAPEGKEFNGWLVDGKTYKPGETLGNITADVTVQAQWKDTEYTASFDANGGEGSIAAATVVHGDNYTLPENGFTAPEGKEFNGWLVDGKTYKPGDTLENVAGNVTVQAQWKDAEYTVSFDTNGGSGDVTAATVTHGDSYVLPENGFTAPEGKEFNGWLVDGKTYKPGDTLENVAGNVTVQAQWKDTEYTISFAANGGSGDVTAATVTHGDSYVLPENGFTAPKGKEFNGWLVDGKTYKPGDTLENITADVTVQAQWKELPETQETETSEPNEPSRTTGNDSIETTSTSQTAGSKPMGTASESKASTNQANENGNIASTGEQVSMLGIVGTVLIIVALAVITILERNKKRGKK